MAVAFLNTNTMQESASTSVTDTTNMSVTSGGTNRCAICWVMFDGDGSDTISSVTYGGNSMTSVAAAVFQPVLNFAIQAFFLVNPPSGTNTLAITGSSLITDIHYNLVAFTGVNQTTPIRPGTFTSDTSLVADPGPETLVVSSNSQDLTATAWESTNALLTSSQTSDGTSSAGVNFCGSDHATTGASSVTHNYTYAGNSTVVCIGFSIQVASAGTFVFQPDEPPQLPLWPIDPIVSVW